MEQQSLEVETMIPTPHINIINKEDVAETVLMPGDPLRAKFIADTFLKDVKEINSVRNMLGFTGYYNGKKITVMGSGMGMPSIGIYSFELYKFYDVKRIIRIGSAGAYTDKLNVYDVVLANSAYSESTFAQALDGSDDHILYPTESLNQAIIEKAKEIGIKLHLAKIHSSDVFYHKEFDYGLKLASKEGVECVEMESFALFANARLLNKEAACLLTISDSLVTHVETTAEERQKSFTEMMRLALEMA